MVASPVHPSMSTTLTKRVGRTRIRTFRRWLLGWVADNLRDFPWRRPGATPYEVLVAELLLKRTTAAAAARAYPTFLERYPDVRALSMADETELSAVLQPLGLSRQRARAIRQLALALQGRGGRIPKNIRALEGLPGLGAYAARAVMTFGFGIRTAVVDGNVERVLRRVFGRAVGPNAARHAIVELAGDLLPRMHHREFNFALIDLGAEVCKPANPRCHACPLRKGCDYGMGRLPLPVVSPLKNLRMDRGDSLTALAARAGVTRLTIINIEAGRTHPRPETLGKLSQALHMPVAELRAHLAAGQ